MSIGFSKEDLRMDLSSSIPAMYAAFNRRDADTVLAFMSEDVSWPKASEGGRVLGRQAVREYWTRQWADFDPLVNVLEVIDRANDIIAVKVRQLVKNLRGNILSDTELWHVYTLTNGLIGRMDIEDGGHELDGPSTAFSRTEEAP
jgi:hypothetical protein